MQPESSNAVFELRPMNLADLLDAVVRLYRHDFWVLIRIAAVVHVPLGVLQIAGSTMSTGGMPGEGQLPTMSGYMAVGMAALGLYWLLFFLSMPVVQGAMAKAVAQTHLGEETSVRAAYQFALRRWFNLLMATLLQGLAQIGAVLIPLIPAGVLVGGVIFAGDGASDVGAAGAVAGLVGMLVAAAVWTVVLIKLFFGPLTVVLEDRGAVEALRRSWNLTTEHLVRVGLTMFIVGVLTVILTYALIVPVQLGAYALTEASPAVAQALSGASTVFAQLLLQPVQIIATVLLYYDLRMRKEGFDLVMMAESINQPELARRTDQGQAQPSGALYGPEASDAQPPAPPPPSSQNGEDYEPPD